MGVDDAASLFSSHQVQASDAGSYACSDGECARVVARSIVLQGVREGTACVGQAVSCGPTADVQASA